MGDIPVTGSAASIPELAAGCRTPLVAVQGSEWLYKLLDLLIIMRCSGMRTGARFRTPEFNKLALQET
jgi:hypothetical protein